MAGICSSACCSRRPVSELCSGATLRPRASVCCAIIWQDKPNTSSDVLNASLWLSASTRMEKKSDNEPQLRGRIKWDLNGLLLISPLQEVVTMQEKVFFKPVFDWTMTWKPCYNYSSATLMNRNNANGMIELWQKATFSSIMISGFSGGGEGKNAKLCLVSLRKKWLFLLTVWQINTTAIVNNDDKWSECWKQTLCCFALSVCS